VEEPTPEQYQPRLTLWGHAWRLAICALLSALVWSSAFVEQFEQHIKMIARFAEATDQYVPYLVRKAEHIEDYLQK